MSQPFRALLPASGGQTPDGTQTPSLSTRQIFDVPRRISVPAACDPCRSRRSKCDGQRPSCAACINRGVECEYETEPTETRTQALKRKVKDLRDKLGAHEDLYQFLASRSDEEISMILERIKAGVEINTLRDMIRSGDMLLQFAHRPDRTTADSQQSSTGTQSDRNQIINGASTNVDSYVDNTVNNHVQSIGNNHVNHNVNNTFSKSSQSGRVPSVGDRLSISALLTKEQSPTRGGP